jgi:iron(III) transport system substrate-binding protein
MMKRTIAVLAFLCMAAAVFAGLYRFACTREQYKVAETSHDVIRVYTDMPATMISSLGEEFLDDTNMQLEVVPLTTQQILDDSLKSAQPADVILTAEETLQQLEIQEHLVPYTSEQTDTVLTMYKSPTGSWTGVWINPGVFVVNKDFYSKNQGFTYTWDQVMNQPNIRLCMTDFVASSEAADLLVSLAEHFGTDGAMGRLAMAGHHVVQYGKFLSTPSRMAAMNKCDIGISGYNEARQAEGDGFPVTVIYPDDGSPWYLYGAGIPTDSPHMDRAKLFINWLLSGEGHREALEKAGYYYITTNDTASRPDARGRELAPWELSKIYFREGRQSLLNTWVHTIRFQVNGE